MTNPLLNLSERLQDFGRARELAAKLDIDLVDSAHRKISINEQRYPVARHAATAASTTNSEANAVIERQHLETAP